MVEDGFLLNEGVKNDEKVEEHVHEKRENQARKLKDARLESAMIRVDSVATNRKADKHTDYGKGDQWYRCCGLIATEHSCKRGRNRKGCDR